MWHNTNLSSYFFVPVQKRRFWDFCGVFPPSSVFIQWIWGSGHEKSTIFGGISVLLARNGLHLVSRVKPIDGAEGFTGASCAQRVGSLPAAYSSGGVGVGGANGMETPNGARSGSAGTGPRLAPPSSRGTPPVKNIMATSLMKASSAFCPTGYIANTSASAASSSSNSTSSSSAAAAASNSKAKSSTLVPVPCSGNGNCSMGECSCFPGWFGHACDQATAVGPCPNRCSGRGICDATTGHCICEPGFVGADCSTMSATRIASDAAACSNLCGDLGTGSHGKCVGGSCVCAPGYTGVACTLRTCPNECSNSLLETRGECIDGRCICHAGFGGSDCSVQCPNSCSGHGACHSEDRTSNGSVGVSIRCVIYFAWYSVSVSVCVCVCVAIIASCTTSNQKKVCVLSIRLSSSRIINF